jgi:hypothetical protein
MPADREMIDETRRIKVSWRAFFGNLEKYPAAALTDLAPTATTAQIVTQVNALAAILRANKLLSE